MGTRAGAPRRRRRIMRHPISYHGFMPARRLARLAGDAVAGVALLAVALSVALLETWGHTDNPDPEETL